MNINKDELKTRLESIDPNSSTVSLEELIELRNRAHSMGDVPLEALALVKISTRHMLLGQFEEELLACRELCVICEDRWQFLFSLGIAEVRAGNISKGLDTLRKAYDLASADTIVIEGYTKEMAAHILDEIKRVEGLEP